MLTRSYSQPILCALLFFNATPVFADAYDQFRIGCNSNELSALNAAVQKAGELATKASAALPPLDSSGGARFRKWFGGADGDYDPVIKDVYNEMGLNLLFQKFWCLPPNSTTPERWIHTNAFILKGTVGEIFVLSNFFSLPVSGASSRGGTIVHEAAHQSTKRKIIDDDIDGDGKDDYGPAVAKKRATISLSKARANSDNYKYFAEDVMYGVP
jgi:hypothetical protein